MSNKKITDEQLERGKTLYMEYKSVTEIANTLSLPKSTIHYWTKKWSPERELKKAELFAQMHEIKKVQFTEMTSATVTIMQRALTDLAKRSKSPSMSEARTAASILETLDKITRLDEGNPTDIVSDINIPLTVEAIKKKVALDPFQAAEELVEYKEVEENRDA